MTIPIKKNEDGFNENSTTITTEKDSKNSNKENEDNYANSPLKPVFKVNLEDLINCLLLSKNNKFLQQHQPQITTKKNPNFLLMKI